MSSFQCSVCVWRHTLDQTFVFFVLDFFLFSFRLFIRNVLELDFSFSFSSQTHVNVTEILLKFVEDWFVILRRLCDRLFSFRHCFVFDYLVRVCDKYIFFDFDVSNIVELAEIDFVHWFILVTMPLLMWIDSSSRSRALNAHTRQKWWTT